MKKHRLLRLSVLALCTAFCFLSFRESWKAGILILSSWTLFFLLWLWQKHSYKSWLKKLNQDLDRLLQQGILLPIDAYQEGELSVLASQMEKITLRLTQAADCVRREKENLADSMADISHQLRTPMTAMNLAVTMLHSPDLEQSRRMELTCELRKQLSRMDWLVETMLKISKLDAGTVTLAQEDIPLERLIRKAAEPLEIPMELKEQQLEIDCGDGLFRGDLNWTAEALGNILKNAMEHTPQGGTVSIHVEDTPVFTEIRIRDTGEGFSQEDLSHLFDRFYRGSHAGPASCGIGLSLARSIITAQNGTVLARNGEKGAEFIIKFYKQVI